MDTSGYGEEKDFMRPVKREKLILDNPEACGMGRDAQCCAWLLAGGDGFECGRVTELREYIASRATGRILPQFNARRLPTEPYPECQIFKGETQRPSSATN